MTRGRVLPWAPSLTVALMLGPVAAGLAGVLAPAFGWMPALGATDPGLAAFADLFAWPGLGASVRLSVTTGLASTALALAITILICAGWSGTRAFAAIERALAPLLSIPHAAAAFAIAFLIAPSGWVMRLISPWATGVERPPDWAIVGDPWGLSMTAGLVAKEVPFLLLMTLSALGQVKTGQARVLAATMGYGRVRGWLRTVLPAVYPQIRLPVYAVLAYAMSVVDVAAILGPTTPPPLSAQVVRWMSDPDLTLRLRAAAGAVLQLGLVIGALILWRVGEGGVARLGRAAIWRGRRGSQWGDAALRVAGLGAATLCAGAIFVGLAALAVWSVSGFWAFPDAWPMGLTGATWANAAPSLADTARQTALIAGAATGLAVLLTLACLEAEVRHGLKPGSRALWLLYVPLLVPQVAFLTGLQTLALMAGLDGGVPAVVAAHLVFVLPYVFLSLSDPFRAWDARYATVAHAMGAGPERVLWAVRLPMLLRPVLTAAAVGFAASVGQYLPTLLIGAGRVETLTTEAVALAAGGNRRVIGVYALAQTAAALLPFALAIFLPRIIWRNRRGVMA